MKLNKLSNKELKEFSNEELKELIIKKIERIEELLNV
ncbi:MAG: hypothetical protein KatS3mg003_2065 [Candidatus Nitrosocaldaceae archaeon]|nr:MAG: hypothetical protein KatS3mg003_2065 [Candidatus Nitrosocaldaceae archaeon]